MTKKIALIGSAPSSVALAPYADPTWTLWACSPGARPHLKRTPNAFFELHLYEPDQPWFAPEYVNYLAGLHKENVPVFMLEPIAPIPSSVAYPKEEMVGKYGPYFFTSSLAWMFALALEQNPDEIGLWGVDMSASEEIYTGQRAGCQFFIHEAMKRGIRVTIPYQSDLAKPTPLYGYCEQQPLHQKLLARKAELIGRLNGARQQHASLANEIAYLQGAAEDCDYMLKTWVSDRQAEDMLLDNRLSAPVAPAPIVLPATSTVAASGPVAEVPTQVAPAPDGTFNHKLPPKVDIATELLPVPQVTWASTPAPEFINGALG